MGNIPVKLDNTQKHTIWGITQKQIDQIDIDKFIDELPDTIDRQEIDKHIRELYSIKIDISLTKITHLLNSVNMENSKNMLIVILRSELFLYLTKHQNSLFNNQSETLKKINANDSMDSIRQLINVIIDIGGEKRKTEHMYHIVKQLDTFYQKYSKI